MTAVAGDDGVPNVARMYDYLLGGSHNFAADRERAEQVIAARPSTLVHARANRAFLRHVVEQALDRGVRQFLDLGSGIPTVGNVHEVAHRRDPAARVAYVDNEPVAIAHSAAILASEPNVTISDGDLRDPEAVLGAPGVRDLLDLAEPVAVLALASLHFTPDDATLGGLLARYRRDLAPGSLLALTHVSDDYPDHPNLAREAREVTALVASTSNPQVLRSRSQLRAVVSLGGFNPDEAGPVDLARWALPPRDEPVGGYALTTEPTR